MPGHNPCCPGGFACIACKGGVYPPNLSLTIAGVGNAFCNDCGNVNDTFIIPITQCCGLTWPECGPPPEGSGQSNAHYFAGFGDVAICTTMLISVRAVVWWNRDNVAGRREIQVNVEWAGIPIIVWRLTENGQDDPFDCEAFDSLNIPFSGIGIECAGTPTCLLSAA